ncbi:MAG: TIGR03013 family XrtA/PEP-CTERM system glycosyltransferase [Gammaproteobacteria bacterium]|nr:TIGR03013 family XrtA/PEP-CTERM system glycosyltransferase [Gammaproteobacteria bacterium]
MAFRIFRHYVAKDIIALLIAEGMILFFSIYAGMSISFGDPSAATKVLVDPIAPRATLFTVIMLGAMASSGLYQSGLREGLWGIVVRLLVSFGLGFLGMIVAFYFLPAMYIGLSPFLVSFAVAMFGIGVGRYLFFKVSDHDALRKRTLILGAGEDARELAMLRRRSDHRGLKLLGYVALPAEPMVLDESKVIRTNKPLPELARELLVDEIVVATDDRHPGFPVEEVVECKMSGIEVIDRVKFYERQIGKINVDLLRPIDIIFLDGFSHAVLKSYSKRAFDILFSLVMLMLAAPIMLLAAVAILIESRIGEPVLYRQERVGRNGRVFEVIKFRSMGVDAEKAGQAIWAGANDPRVTRVGAFMRKTRIDELPQLFNVLRGDMSFVGPRPERPQFVEELSVQIPYFGMRHRVNPGITGWAQVSYSYGASVEDAKQKLQYDLYYIKNYSIFLDLAIIMQTIQVVLWGQGAR